MKKPAYKPISRQGRYSAYDRFLADIEPRSMTKRAKYLHGIGVFRGLRGDTAWLKIRLPLGGIFNGKSYEPDESIEIKVGNLESFTWAALEELRIEYQGKADRGEPLEAVTAPLFNEYVDQWLAIQKPRLLGYPAAEGIVKNHLKPFFGNMTIDRISITDVNRWQSQQLAIIVNPLDVKEGKAPITMNTATVKRQKVVLASILSAGVKEGHCSANPCLRSDRLRIAETAPRFLTGAELVRFLKVAQEEADWLPDYILWSITSGMRKGEMAALSWSNVVELNDQLAVTFRTGKTQKIRTIFCGDLMKDILKRQKERTINVDSRVFPIAPITLKRKWAKVRKAANVPDITIQHMRSTNATYAASSGVDLRTLAARLGHSNLDMMERHYAAVVGSVAVEASTRIEQRVNQLLSGS